MILLPRQRAAGMEANISEWLKLINFFWGRVIVDKVVIITGASSGIGRALGISSIRHRSQLVKRLPIRLFIRLRKRLS